MTKPLDEDINIRRLKEALRREREENKRLRHVLVAGVVPAGAVYNLRQELQRMLKLLPEPQSGGFATAADAEPSP